MTCIVSCGFSSRKRYASSALSNGKRCVIHFSGLILSNAFHATSNRRDLSHLPERSGAIVLTCEEISLIRERWNAPPRSISARFCPYHEPMTIRPLKVVNSMASFKVQGEPLSSKVRSKKPKVESLPCALSNNSTFSSS